MRGVGLWGGAVGGEGGGGGRTPFLVGLGTARFPSGIHRCCAHLPDHILARNGILLAWAGTSRYFRQVRVNEKHAVRGARQALVLGATGRPRDRGQALDVGVEGGVGAGRGGAPTVMQLCRHPGPRAVGQASRAAVPPPPRGFGAATHAAASWSKPCRRAAGGARVVYTRIRAVQGRLRRHLGFHRASRLGCSASCACGLGGRGAEGGDGAGGGAFRAQLLLLLNSFR